MLEVTDMSGVWNASIVSVVFVVCSLVPFVHLSNTQQIVWMGQYTYILKWHLVMNVGQNINLVKPTHFDGRSHNESG